jgi:hypothetical protein
LKSLSKASLGSRGGLGELEVISFSTVDLISKVSQLLCTSFRGTLAAIGREHSKRLEGSKNTQFLQVCKSALHFGHWLRAVISPNEDGDRGPSRLFLG